MASAIKRRNFFANAGQSPPVFLYFSTCSRSRSRWTRHVCRSACQPVVEDVAVVRGNVLCIHRDAKDAFAIEAQPHPRELLERSNEEACRHDGREGERDLHDDQAIQNADAADSRVAAGRRALLSLRLERRLFVIADQRPQRTARQGTLERAQVCG